MHPHSTTLLPEPSHVTGVYSITNIHTGQCYIGSTCRSFKKRWREHHQQLDSGRHDNPGLLRDWIALGAEAFTFEVREYIKDASNVAEKEQAYLDNLRANDMLLYNVGNVVDCPRLGQHHTEAAKAKIGEASRRRVTSEATRQRLSAAFKGRPISPEHNRKWHEVKAVTYPALRHMETGELIPAGRNLSAMCRDYGLRYSCVREVIAGTHRFHQGWRLLEAAS